VGAEKQVSSIGGTAGMSMRSTGFGDVERAAAVVIPSDPLAETACQGANLQDLKETDGVSA
jgi:hypothetical protein